MKFIIGIDGGGSKTEAVAYDVNGNIIGRAETGFGNLLLNRKEALKNIIEAAEECSRDMNMNDCQFIYVGLAGIEAGDNKAAVIDALKKHFKCNVGATNDADIAHSAILMGEDGILLISGTGSIALGKYKGQRERAGGWGHILGDEGSGYYIALMAFKRMVEEEDESLLKSMLSLELMKKLRINSVHLIKGFVYSSTKDQIAAFAPLVAECAENGDSYSQLILKYSGEALAKLVENVCRKLNYSENVKIALKGSIISNIKAVSDSFEERIYSKFPNAKIIKNDISSTKGAYYEALKELNLYI